VTTPVGPKDFPLSRDWWLSGSAWHAKTAEDVWKVLGVMDRPPRQRSQAVRLYYQEHQDRLEFVPEELRGPLGLSGRMALLAPDASDADIDAFIEHLKSAD
jgi:hypothetical protein